MSSKTQNVVNVILYDKEINVRYMWHICEICICEIYVRCMWDISPSPSEQRLATLKGKSLIRICLHIYVHYNSYVRHFGYFNHLFCAFVALFAGQKFSMFHCEELVSINHLLTRQCLSSQFIAKSNFPASNCTYCYASVLILCWFAIHRYLFKSLWLIY